MFNTPFEKTKSALSKLGLEIEQEYKTKQNNEIYCKVCKTNLSDFLETGFVGCARCYDYFNQYIKGLALDVHGRVNHIGKVPKAEVSKAMKKRELERLIIEKEEAAKNENYILAEELKNKINRLREEIR